MNYELAKKLKDAGFPQGDGVEDYNPFRYINKDGVYDYCNIDGSFCYTPTLSELMEACGGNNFALRFQRGAGWDAVLEKTHAHGYSPKEAVANLWLALRSVSRET